MASVGHPRVSVRIRQPSRARPGGCYSHRYSSHYIIKSIGIMSIYYAINLDIVSYFIVFSNFYLGSIDSNLNQ